MTVTAHARCEARHASSGQMLVLFALTLAIFIGGALLGVDLTHLRAEVERAQHAANAAALAGVVFMPNYQAQAFYRAQEEATKNGYTTNAAQGVSVTPATVPGHNYRLKVTISAPVSLFFGHVFGLDKKQISVSATAEFLPPLQMGSPDYVLGFPRFPSYLTYDGSNDSSRTPQNFYLTQEGPYTYKEQGDPFSPYFESATGPGYAGGVGNGPNPCTTNATTCPDLNPAPVLNKAQQGQSGANFDGYKYVISIPDNRTVLVKLFNPFSEMNYNAIAYCWDRGYQGAPTEIRGLWAESGYPSYMCNGTYSSSQQQQLAQSPLSGLDITPKDTSGHCLLGTQGGSCRNESIDGSLYTSFGPLNQYGPDYNNTPGYLAQTTLEFSLTGPGQSLLDPAMTTTPVTLLGSSSSDKCAATNENCVIAAPFDGGDDPTHCGTDYCNQSAVAFKFVNYAILHGPGYFQLKVRSVVNSNGTYGESNHSYGIAVCDAATDPTYTGNANPLGSVATNTYVTADPLSTNPLDNGWNASACLSPNNPTTCPNPRLAAPGTCVQIYAQGSMPLYNYLAAGSSLIPLGYIPADYAGQTINVSLFDPGDVQSSTASPASIFGCLVPASSSSGVVPENSMEVLTPAGDLQCGSPNHVDGHTNTLGTNTQPGSLPYTFLTAPDYSSSGYKTSGSVSKNANQPLDVGNNSGGGNPSRIYNGTWVHMSIAIPSNYAQMVNGDSSPNSAFGAYWKVLYRIGGDATDVTTWSLNVAGSAVHLVHP